MDEKMKRIFRIAGVDAGFRKLGLSLVVADKTGERLVVAETVDNIAEEGSTMQSDIRCCFILGEGLSSFIGKQKPDAIFVEMPGGGGQGARAHRCMGLATGVVTEVLRVSGVKFQIYSPGRVEELLGVKAKRDSKDLTKANMRALKKSRLEEKVMAAFPDFTGWPSTKRLKEDAADSVAVVLAGKAEGLLRLFPSVCFEEDNREIKVKGSMLEGLE